MQQTLRHSWLAAICGLLVGLSACSKKDEPTPAPTPTVTVAAAAHTPQAVKAQAWFEGRRHAASSATGRVALAVQPAINWEQAVYSQEYVVAPFVDTFNPFADTQKYGYRFLVVRVAADSSCTGRIVELIADRQPVEAAQAARLALAGTKPFLAGYSPGSVDGLTGSLLVYSPGYAYETGLAYAAGALQAGKMTLVTTVTLPEDASPGDCYNFFQVVTTNGVQTAIQLLATLCAGGIPGTGDSGGSSGGGGWGGVSTPGTTAPPQMPCQALTRDGQNAQVVAQLNALDGLLTDNREHGLTISYDAAGNPSFNTAAGLPDSLSIGNWTIPGGASAIVHTHYSDPNSLSVFSPADLQSLWLYYHNNSPANLSTFTFTIITASGTVYSLAVTNPAAFTTFANSKGLSSSLFSLNVLFGAYQISSSNTVAQNELAFMKMLIGSNTGLTLYKGDPSDFASWQKLSFTKNATLTSSPCN